jgi:hypothetical protein
LAASTNRNTKPMKTKHDIIKAIAEHDGTITPDFIKRIYNASKDVLNAPTDENTIRAINDSISYLLHEIDRCTILISKSTSGQEVMEYERQRAKYRESLTKCLQKL